MVNGDESDTLRAEIYGGYARGIKFSQVPLDEIKLFYEHLGVMRFVNASDQFVMDVLVTEGRHQLWQQASFTARRMKLIQDPVPLRFWVPFLFVEPMCRPANPDVLRATSWLWQWAPFEVLLEEPGSPALHYVFSVEHARASRADASNQYVGSHALIQVLRRFVHLRPIRYTVRCRWLP